MIELSSQMEAVAEAQPLESPSQEAEAVLPSWARSAPLAAGQSEEDLMAPSLERQGSEAQAG